MNLNDKISKNETRISHPRGLLFNNFTKKKKKTNSHTQKQQIENHYINLKPN